jgi:hypothetical protein
MDISPFTVIHWNWLLTKIHQFLYGFCLVENNNFYLAQEKFVVSRINFFCPIFNPVIS